jgi:hypothetical protein
MRLDNEVTCALTLLVAGHTPTEVARMTGLPRETVRDWSYGRRLRQRRRHATSPCSSSRHLSQLSAGEDGYLLGMYLGDGCISEYLRGVMRMRVTLDAIYP